jgi:hypothetical protein
VPVREVDRLRKLLGGLVRIEVVGGVAQLVRAAES